MKLALIDLGSNSARMDLVHLHTDGSSQYLSRDRIMTRLSEGMGTEKILRELPMTRTIKALSAFSEKSRSAGAEILAVATAAVRSAKNGSAFCSAVEKETGIRLHVISGQQEAALDFAGVMAGLPHVKDCLITDTGGGSTELILVKNRQICAKTSLPFGAVNLFETYSCSDTKTALNQAAAELDSSFSAVDFLPRAQNLPLVGLGGSVCSLFYAGQKLLPEHTPAKLHGCAFSFAEVLEIFSRLSALFPEARQNAGIEPERAKTVCHGILPTILLMNRLDSPKLFLSAAGLREGILAKISSGKPETFMKNMELFFTRLV